MKNLIQFRKGFLNLEQTNENNDNIAMSVVAELMQFGFLLKPDAILHLSKASKNSIIDFSNEIINFLKVITGSQHSYKPFWKGFPTEVMEKTETELWLHQIIHYISNGKYEPNEFTKQRSSAFEQPNYTIIGVGDDILFNKILTTLVSGNQSLTSEDLGYVKWFIHSGQMIEFSNIPFKENLCTVASEIYKSGRNDVSFSKLTVNDVLRISVGMSNGDVSLPSLPNKKIKINSWTKTMIDNPHRELFKFKKFSRSERRFILTLLENTSCDVKEGILKSQRWVRLGEVIHPFEYKSKFPKSFSFFNSIRNEKVKSWYGDLNVEFSKSLELGLIKLSERSGEYVRKLDSLFRNNKGKEELILNSFINVMQNTSNKVLYEVYTHFGKRNLPVQNRGIMIKGSRKRTVLPDLEPLNQKLIDKLQSLILNVLRTKYAKLPSMGACFLDEELKKIPLPSNMRSLNASLKPVIRGQRVSFGNENTKVIRAFVHWFDECGNQDIDLSATFIGMGQISTIGWNAIHNSDIGCYSGDVRNKQGACAEYIDVDILESLKSGFRYVMLDARNYNGSSFESIKDCVFGYMEREFPKENEIFVPKTLSNTIRLMSQASNSMVAILDLKELEYIFLDIDTDGIPVATGNIDKILECVKSYTELPKFSVYDLLKLHVESRGFIVNKESAENIYTLDTFDNYTKIIEFMGI